jgi:hypothetical protein
VYAAIIRLAEPMLCVCTRCRIALETFEGDIVTPASPSAACARRIRASTVSVCPACLCCQGAEVTLASNKGTTARVQEGGETLPLFFGQRGSTRNDTGNVVGNACGSEFAGCINLIRSAPADGRSVATFG